MSTNNNNLNSDDQMIIKIITSPLAKTIIAMLIITAGFSYKVSDAKNDIKSDIISINTKMIDMNNEIKLQNQAMKFEIMAIRSKQDADYKYFTETYAKKSELNKLLSK